MSLKDKTVFITGSSRGIGLAIALRCARDGANIIITGKTTEPHAKLPGTIHDAAAQVEKAGGKALALQLDVRDEQQIAAAMTEAAQRFGGIDILINNASAIFLAGTAETPMKRFDLMHQVNARGTFAASQACLPYLKKSSHAHILMLSPPLNMSPHWFAPHLAYTIAKYGMSLCVLGLAEELKKDKIAVNALWPRTVIDTAAVQTFGGVVRPEHCRTPEIVADAAYAILSAPPTARTGQFLLDEDVLKEQGVRDFSKYNARADAKLMTDLFLDP